MHNQAILNLKNALADAEESVRMRDSDAQRAALMQRIAVKDAKEQRANAAGFRRAISRLERG